MRIFLIGYMGSGKTTIGQVVAKRLGLNFVDMDAYIESQQFKSVSQIFSEMGEEKFREMERKCLNEVSDYEDVVIATGGGVPCYFDNMELMNRKGKTVYISFTAEELAARLRTTSIHKRPLLAKNQHNLNEFISETLSKREPFYSRAKFTVSGTDTDIAQQIINLIQENI